MYFLVEDFLVLFVSRFKLLMNLLTLKIWLILSCYLGLSRGFSILQLFSYRISTFTLALGFFGTSTFTLALGKPIILLKLKCYESEILPLFSTLLNSVELGDISIVHRFNSVLFYFIFLGDSYIISVGLSLNLILLELLLSWGWSMTETSYLRNSVAAYSTSLIIS